MKAVLRQMFNVRSGSRTRWQILETAHTGDVLSLKGANVKMWVQSPPESGDVSRAGSKQQTDDRVDLQERPKAELHACCCRFESPEELSGDGPWTPPWGHRGESSQDPHFSTSNCTETPWRLKPGTPARVLGMRIKKGRWDWIWACSGWKCSFYPF